MESIILGSNGSIIKEIIAYIIPYTTPLITVNPSIYANP